MQPAPSLVLWPALLFSGVLSWAAPAAPTAQFTGSAPPPAEALSLWYRRPAAQWLEAVPLGNGRLGAMVFGGVERERIQLNDDTLWSGGPKQWDNTNALAALPQIRQLIFEGQYGEAHRACRKLMGPYNQSYLPMGDLYLDFGARREIRDYRRDLNLETALASVQYTADGIGITEEMFISHPDQVLVVRLTSAQPGKLSFKASLGSRLRFTTTNEQGTLRLNGRAPAHVDPNYYRRANPIIYDESGDGEGMRFQMRLRATTDDGRIEVNADRIAVQSATRVTLLLAAATSFNGFDRSPGRDGQEPAMLAKAQLASAAERSFEQLRRAHLADHQRLFRRVVLDLGLAPQGAHELPTDERVRQFGAADPGLVALQAQYGRYLLIASARPGTQPPNLQGIWNDEVRPPWSANWTLNINAEMNHWPAEVANLSECHQPFLQLIRELAVTGRRTAQIQYGARGWVAHHNTDIWRQSSPVGDYGHGDASWAIWPMAGPWLCQHLWQHYEFNGDTNWLREFAWPLMKGAAEFCLDFLIEDRQGHLVTAPSTSPEHGFVTPDGQNSAVSMASTMDMSLIWDLFGNCIAASDLLGLDRGFRNQLQAARAKLYPPPIGADGRLQEFFRDFKDREPHHRHLSHLWGLYPGNQFSRTTTPELFKAAQRSLEIRSDEGTGWSTGWKISLRARLGDGDHAFELIRRTLRLGGGGVYANLFGSHPPFQMDGNFAFTAGVAEMLVQSHEIETGDAGHAVRVVHLLPALPKAWPSGSVKGLRARDGFEVDLDWKNGRLSSVKLQSKLGKPCRVRHGEQSHEVTVAAGETWRWDGR